MKRIVLAVVTALLLVTPAAAQASEGQISMMMDDDRLLYRGDAVRDQTLQRMKELGVDTVRVTVLWSVVAERMTRRNRARATNPAAYPRLNWDRYDRLVRAAGTLGLGVYFNVTPPGPSWAHGRAPRGTRGVVARAWKPDARQFARFVEAVGRRFSGRYRDENDGRGLVPRVSFWSIGNEPNQAGWLAPQWERGRPASPRMYRELYLRGRAALDRTGHGRDTILVGETAPLGSARRTATSPIRPRPFLRELTCQTRRGGGCQLFDQFGGLRATGFAHHPYTKDRSPTARDRSRDAITMANIGDLAALLDRAPNLPEGLAIWLTEFGFETNPPDPFSGVPLERQAEWLGLGDFLAWQQPRVAGITQFLLRDVAPVAGARGKGRWFTYQSGVEYADGRAKPGLFTYVFPVLASTAGPGEADVWGQLRFRPNRLPPGAQDVVQVQYAPAGSDAFTDVGAPVTVTSPVGFFTARVPVPGPGSVRAVWQQASPPYASPPTPIR